MEAKIEMEILDMAPIAHTIEPVGLIFFKEEPISLVSKEAILEILEPAEMAQDIAAEAVLVQEAGALGNKQNLNFKSSVKN